MSLPAIKVHFDASITFSFGGSGFYTGAACGIACFVSSTGAYFVSSTGAFVSSYGALAPYSGAKLKGTR